MYNLPSVYNEVLHFAKNHYENFPVVSFLVKKNLRKYIAVIYWFARTADDMADEGDFTSEERLKMLDSFEEKLALSVKGNFTNVFEEALYHTIEDKNLTSEYFFNLLTAFKQDVCKKRYKNFDDLLDYCRNSANPVGRLVLELYGIRNEKAFLLSDKICTALQLTNFYQDTLIDYEKGRIYYPLDEMKLFEIEEKVFDLNQNNLNLSKLLEFNIRRTRKLFDEGKELINYLSGRLKLEIKWTILGGEAVLKKIENNNYNIFRERPNLSKKDFFVLFMKSLTI
ncbi:MAG TPA: squalene synthase HpnC [Ignavibacteriaceae bacterium]|nr:squalene synthase HpnC [Ignavibacteriaceae bacterium]